MRKIMLTVCFLMSSLGSPAASADETAGPACRRYANDLVHRLKSELFPEMTVQEETAARELAEERCRKHFDSGRGTPESGTAEPLVPPEGAGPEAGKARKPGASPGTQEIEEPVRDSSRGNGVPTSPPGSAEAPAQTAQEAGAATSKKLTFTEWLERFFGEAARKPGNERLNRKQP